MNLHYFPQSDVMYIDGLGPMFLGRDAPPFRVQRHIDHEMLNEGASLRQDSMLSALRPMPERFTWTLALFHLVGEKAFVAAQLAIAGRFATLQSKNLDLVSASMCL
jgi:hypothetical protein